MFLIKLTQGSTCSLPQGGCVISLEPNNVGKLVSTNKYLLVSGTANIVYDEIHQQIFSPYNNNANGEWQDYVDSWTYDANTEVRVDPTTEFLQISSPKHNLECTIKTTTVNNSTITVNAKAQSSISIIANSNSVSINNQTVENYFYTHYAPEDTEVQIQASEFCRVLYIETI